MVSEKLKIFSSIIKKNWDFTFIIIFSIIYGIIRSAVPKSNSFITLVALLPILIFPGYCLMIIIFSKKNEVKLYERITLTLIFSVIIITVSGFVLGKINELNFYLTVWVAILIIIILSVIAIILRWKITDSLYPPEISKDNFKKIGLKWKNQTILTKTLSIITVIFILGAFASVIFILEYNFPTPYTTTFSVTDGNGYAVSQIVTGVNITQDIIIKINNLERNDIDYYLEVWLSNHDTANIKTNLTDTNIVLLYENDFLVTKGEEQEVPLNIKIDELGDWSLFFILYKYEVEIPNPIEYTHNEYVELIYDTRIALIINSEISSNIRGLWMHALILPSMLEDTGDKSTIENWYTSSEGWNWTIYSSTNKYSGLRNNSLVDFYTETNNSFIILQVNTGLNTLYPLSNQILVETEITYKNNSENYNIFGLAIDLNKDGASYLARLYSNTTHLIMGICSGYREITTYYTIAIIPYSWTLGEYHKLGIEVDYNKKWVTYMIDDSIVRNSTSDQQYIYQWNKASIILENAVNSSNVILSMDNFNATWIDNDGMLEPYTIEKPILTIYSFNERDLAIDCYITLKNYYNSRKIQLIK